MKPAYLDYNATTPLDPRVFESMRPYYSTEVGNAGSRTHAYGQKARDAVEQARAKVASLLGATADEIVFTSGATESNNVVLQGLLRQGLDSCRTHILATSIEHKSVLGPLERLRTWGFDVELLPVTVGGYVEPEAVRRRLRQDTLLVTMMHSNNETGVIQPVPEISDMLTNSNVLFHIDAAQTFGKEVEALKQVKCDYLSISSHKIYGPTGIGALYLSRRSRRWAALTPLMVGGGQERGLRPGTLPVPLIVGLGAAAELAGKEYKERREHAERLKRDLLAALQSTDHHINGDLEKVQAHVLNVSFSGVDSEALMLSLRSEMAISNGSACTSVAYSMSHVLSAMGLPEDGIVSAVRISWGAGVTQIPHEALLDAVERLRC